MPVIDISFDRKEINIFINTNNDKQLEDIHSSAILHTYGIIIIILIDNFSVGISIGLAQANFSQQTCYAYLLYMTQI